MNEIKLSAFEMISIFSIFVLDSIYFLPHSFNTKSSVPQMLDLPTMCITHVKGFEISMFSFFSIPIESVSLVSLIFV